MPESNNEPKKIIIHCSASPDNMDIGASEIDKWHRERGWSMIGYHSIVRRSGEIEHGRPFHIQGAHCKGHNEDSIGICLIGERDFTDSQVKSLARHCVKLMRKFEINHNDIYGHYEFNSKKTCPNIPGSMLRWLAFNELIWKQRR